MQAKRILPNCIEHGRRLYKVILSGAPFDAVLLAVQLLAIVVVVLSFHALGVLRIMLPAQVTAIAAFDTLLLRAVRRNSGISESADVE